MSISMSGRWVTLEAFDKANMLSRRIRQVKSCAGGRMELITEKFAGKTGVLTLYDGFRASNDCLHRKGERMVFGEAFREMLHRQYPGWRIADLSTEPNLEASLSPSYPRAMLRRGRKAIAAMAAPIFSDVDGTLSFALIWHEYLRRRERECDVSGIALFVPQAFERTTTLRLRYLDPNRACYEAFTYDDNHTLIPIDPFDSGNLDTQIASAGLEPKAKLEPEALLEDQVRLNVQALDPWLRNAPVHGQLVSLASATRGILDLLAVDYQGRLAIIELKASESIHLPLQALDYWLHIKWHLEHGNLTRYFPGVPLSMEPPRLLLAAPATRFHSTNEIILRYLAPDIEAEQIGLALSWGGPVKVMFRHKRHHRSLQ